MIVAAAPWWAGELDFWEGGLLVCGIFLLCGLQLAAGSRIGLSFPLSRACLAALAIAAVQALSLITSVHRDATLRQVLLTLGAAGLAFLFSTEPQSATRRPAAFSWQLYSGCGAVVLGAMIVAVRGLNEYASSFRGDPGWRIFAGFFNPDMAAGFLAMAVLVALGTLWLEMSLLPAFLTGLTVVLGAAALALTGSKGGWLAFVLGLVLLGSLRTRTAKAPTRGAWVRFLAVSGLAAVAAGLCSRVLLSRVASAHAEEAHSTQFRLLVWKSALHMLLHRPVLGWGAGTFGLVYQRYGIAGATDQAHSAYLQAGAEMGLLGLVVFVIAVLTVLWPALGRTLSPDEKPGGALYTLLRPGLAAGVFASAVHAAVDFDWTVPGIWLVFWTAAALLGRATPPSRWSLSDRSGLIVGVVLLALIVPTGLLTGADLARDSARAAMGVVPGAEEVDSQRAEDLLNLAVQLDPLNGDAFLMRARLRLSRLPDRPGPAASDLPAVEWQRVIHDLEVASRRMPTDGVPYYMLGRVSELRGSQAQAMHWYQASLEYDPHNEDALLRLASLAGTQSDPAAPRPWLTRLADMESTPYARIRGVPEDYDLHYLEAWGSLLEVDTRLGRRRDVENDAARALADIEEYASLAKQYVRLEAIWSEYRQPVREELAQRAGHIGDRWLEALKKIGPGGQADDIRARVQRVQNELEAIKDPPAPTE